MKKSLFFAAILLSFFMVNKAYATPDTTLYNNCTITWISAYGGADHLVGMAGMSCTPALPANYNGVTGTLLIPIYLSYMAGNTYPGNLGMNFSLITYNIAALAFERGYKVAVQRETSGHALAIKNCKSTTSCSW